MPKAFPTSPTNCHTHTTPIITAAATATVETVAATASGITPCPPMRRRPAASRQCARRCRARQTTRPAVANRRGDPMLLTERGRNIIL